MMRARRISTFAVLLLTAACGEFAEAPTAPTEPTDSLEPALSPEELAVAMQETGFVPGRVLARFRPGAAVASLAVAEGAAVERSMRDGTRILAVPVGRERVVAAALARSPLVEFAEPDVVYTLDLPCGTGSCPEPTDPSFGYRWDLHNDGTITDASGTDLAATGRIDADIDWLEAFDVIGTVPGSAVIGIIDSGIRSTHQELAGKVIAGYDFFAGDPDPADDNGHGTHVAGIAAGGGNDGVGVPGVAWIPEVELAAAKVCGILFGFLYGCPSSAIADGIQWATDNGANVLNISLGGPEGSSVVQGALQYARQNGVLPICAAGNDSGSVSFPGAFPECIAVSSTNWADELASYSNFGPEVQLAAPGGDYGDPNDYGFILSAINDSDVSYAWLAGTSMASPQAAGLAGLLHALGVTDDDAKLLRMQSSANDLGAPGPDQLYGAGRINVYAAIADLVGAPANQLPTPSFSVTCDEYTCAFTDESTDGEGSVVAWDWNFGDGNTSTEQHPTHTYAADGTYTVTLTASDDEGASAATSQDVTVPAPNQPPVASFTSSCSALTCDFTDTSTDPDGSVVGWAWDFGDGNASTEQSPSHTYAAPGTYTVTLTVTDDDGDVDSASGPATATEPNTPPVAGFTWSCSGLTCSFTDTSTDSDGTIPTYQWDFGDGWGTNAQNPNHTYGAPGTFTVTHWVIDDDGAADTVSAPVTVFAPGEEPTASFTVSCTDRTCDFTDTSTDDQGSVVAWDWDFGDGNTSTEQHPTHTYAADGTYTVTLTATDDVGASDDFTRDVTVPSGNQPPVASFTSSCSALTCDFTDTSADGDGSVASWAWDFGDGNTSSVQSPSHPYAAPGTYTVTLTVTDDGGATDATAQSVTVVEPNAPPVAGFTWSCSGLTCSFTDTSTDSDGTITTYQWDFGDGQGTNAQSPNHTYGVPGTYTVTHWVFDDDAASDTVTTSIEVGAFPTASFDVSCSGLDCDFTDTSTDPDGSVVFWSWDFGDGVTSFAQNPSHSYVAAGSYSVTLTVSDDDGAEDTTTQIVDVTAPQNQPPVAGFTSSCTDLDCGFTDTSTDADGSIVAWAWDFGDGNASTAQSPSHAYAAAGAYTVSLTVTDDQGATDTVTQPVTVTEPEPIVLSAVGYRERGRQRVDLSWSGATTASIDVYRDGVIVFTTPNDGFETDPVNGRGSGSYVYRICEEGTARCSSEVTVTF